MKALKKVALPLNCSHPVCRNAWPLTSITFFAFCTFNPLLIFSLWGEFLSFCCLNNFCLCLNEGVPGVGNVCEQAVGGGRVGSERGVPRVFGKVLDSKNAKTGRVFGDYLPPISYVVAEANGPREGQGITHSITRTSERRTGGWGGAFIPFHPVWLVLSTDDILHLLVVAHGFPTPLGLGEYFLAPFIIVNLRRAILTPTACVCSVAQ